MYSYCNHQCNQILYLWKWFVSLFQSMSIANKNCNIKLNQPKQKADKISSGIAIEIFLRMKWMGINSLSYHKRNNFCFYWIEESVKNVWWGHLLHLTLKLQLNHFFFFVGQFMDSGSKKLDFFLNLINVWVIIFYWNRNLQNINYLLINRGKVSPKSLALV